MGGPARARRHLAPGSDRVARRSEPGPRHRRRGRRGLPRCLRGREAVGRHRSVRQRGVESLAYRRRALDGAGRRDQARRRAPVHPARPHQRARRLRDPSQLEVRRRHHARATGAGGRRIHHRARRPGGRAAAGPRRRFQRRARLHRDPVPRRPGNAEQSQRLLPGRVAGGRRRRPGLDMGQPQPLRPHVREPDRRIDYVFVGGATTPRVGSSPPASSATACSPRPSPATTSASSPTSPPISASRRSRAPPRPHPSRSFATRCTRGHLSRAICHGFARPRSLEWVHLVAAITPGG